MTKDVKQMMNLRLSPLWWPVLAVASPIAVPWLLVKNRRFREKHDKRDRKKQDKQSNPKQENGKKQEPQN